MAAAKQLARLLRYVPLPAASGERAIERLMQLYRERPDLQEVYPEAADGNLQRLINWAAGVATKQFVDSSAATLAPSAVWYCANRKPDELSPPSPWPVAVETAKASRHSHSVTLSVMQDSQPNDISHHLLTMSLIVHEFGVKNIVELGTRSGNSTLALLEAAHANRGRVVSVDIEDCKEARARVKAAGLEEHWSFIVGDDLKLDQKLLPDPIELLFIDTSHLYAHTLAELNRFGRGMREGSWILLHDYVEFPGVRRAVHEFIDTLPYRPSFYPFAHQNGLAVIRLGGTASQRL
jgi:predicted O-methyltransferase YrrM